MQEQLYEDAPYIVTAYTTIGEAFRNDQFACFQPQPDPGGVWLVQYGGHNYPQLRPAAEAGDCDGVTTALGAEARAGGGSDPTAAAARPCWSLAASSSAVLVVGGGRGCSDAARRPWPTANDASREGKR